MTRIKFSITQFQIFIITLLLIGVFFRFINLDQKAYWLDETHTSLRVSSYTEPEFIQNIFTGHVVSSEHLLEYQRPNPEKGLLDTMKVLAGNTEHTPLYYLMARFWVQWFGSSVAVTRSLSALISLLVFPGIYWLCLELFESPLVGWIAIGLISTSPFHVLYAQEARPYSLLTVTTLLSSAALLRARRVGTKLSWILYAVTVAIGFYSHWFFGFVAIAHGVYAAVLERFRLNRTIIAHLLASLAGLLAFSPWILVTITAPPPLHKQMSWVYQQVPLFTLVKSWTLSISRPFVDLDRGWCLPPNSSSCRYLLSYDETLIYLLILPLLVIVSYSIYLLCRKTPKQVWFFVLSFIGVPALALILPDLILGGQRSSATRYLIPCLVGVQLAVAYCLTTKIFSSSSHANQEKLWKIILVVLISLGVLSCGVSSEAEGWWNKGGNYHVAPIARTINNANQPLLLYSVPSNVVWGKGGAVGRVVPLTRLLEPNVGILFVVQPNVPEKLPDGFKDIFLYRPHKQLKEWIEKGKNRKLELVVLHQLPEEKQLWKVKISKNGI